ncbi:MULTISPECIES: hypothetical protein, partial [unclassified Azospirillum]|uniref:hypothetical protein n=1 Tax=unclassified Azospirillum TaxID=2630922 RepID=UPI00190EF25A
MKTWVELPALVDKETSATGLATIAPPVFTAAPLTAVWAGATKPEVAVIVPVGVTMETVGVTGATDMVGVTDVTVTVGVTVVVGRLVVTVGVTETVGVVVVGAGAGGGGGGG